MNRSPKSSVCLASLVVESTSPSTDFDTRVAVDEARVAAYSMTTGVANPTVNSSSAA